MPFQRGLLGWNAPGVEIPQSIKDTGWAAQQKPLAAYFNWTFYILDQALRELQEKAGEIKTVNNQSPDVNGNITIDTATAWEDINNKPIKFPPSSHAHSIGDVTDLQTTLNNKANATDLETHTGNTMAHITAAERTTWNNKPTVQTGSSTFAGNNSYRQINHTLGSTPSHVSVTPTQQNPNGYLGEVWVYVYSTYFRVYNSGSNTGNFTWMAVK